MAPKRKADTKATWEFEDNDGNWIAYAAEDSTYLEGEFQSGKKMLQTTKLSFNKDYGTTYKFDFKAMTQLNTESKTKRTIRRNEPTEKKDTKRAKKMDSSDLKGKTLVFTGTLSMKRDEATTLAEKAGAKVTSAISGKTDIVVAGPGAGDKLAKAKAQNCEIWTEEEFQNAVGKKNDSSSRENCRGDIGEEACPEAGARVHFCGCLMNDVVVAGWTSIPYKEDQYGEYVGIGRYPDNQKAFPNAIKATFDSVAVDAGTRVIIYEKKNFKGKVLWDQVGPAIICNEIWKDNTFHKGKKYEDVFKGEWKEPLNTIFPPEVRELSTTNMHNWNSGSLVIEGGQAIPDRVDSLPEYARLSNPRR